MPHVATEDPAELLRRHFGFDQFKPGQRQVIEHLLAGRSAAAVFPTGGGKSLCYQLPAMALPGVTLVVSPLIALMKDQIDALQRRGIAAQRLDSTLSLDDYCQAMRALREDRLKLLYVAPERFMNERFRQVLVGLRVGLFAVDEAHCISEWGHNFRPDYLKLARFAQQFKAERVLALTATAPPPVLKDICRGFEIDRGCAVTTGFYRPNLTMLLTRMNGHQRDAELEARLRKRPPGPTIVYVTLQRTAEHVAERLRAAGFDAHHYHAGMERDERTAVQDRFMAGDRAIVVATIAFGMGIDKANIRYVYHYNLPKSLENYAQEVGRAGRDGEPSTCEVFVCGDDLEVLENFITADTPSREAVESIVADIFDHGEQLELGVHELAKRFGTRPLVVRTLLTYLELLGYLEGGTPVYTEYRFKPHQTGQRILARFEGERRAFLAGVFRLAKRGKTWLTIDVAEVARRLETPRSRVVRALDWLAEQRMIELRAGNVRYQYRRLKRPEDRGALAGKLDERMRRREDNEMKRLHQMYGLAAHRGCQVAAVCEHFGQTLDGPCGHCSWCLRQQSQPS